VSGNMRDLGVRSLAVSCWQCHHQAELSADPVRRRRGAELRAAHGVHQLGDHRCRRSAELEGTAAPGEPDRGAVAVHNDATTNFCPDQCVCNRHF
jgi:hypothetical protein